MNDPMVPIVRAAVDTLNTMATSIRRLASTIASSSGRFWNFHRTMSRLKATATPMISRVTLPPAEE